MNLSYWCGGSMGCIKLTMKWGAMRVRDMGGSNLEIWVIIFLKTCMEIGEKDIRLIKPKSLDS